MQSGCFSSEAIPSSYYRGPAALLRAVVDERDALPLVLEVRAVAPAAGLALVFGGRQGRPRLADLAGRGGLGAAVEVGEVADEVPDVVGVVAAGAHVVVPGCGLEVIEREVEVGQRRPRVWNR